jgi:hypothetical protein
MENAILTTAYLGSIQYYTKLLMYRQVFIEQYDSYHKQTCRNRCRILAANGPLDLTIPVVKVKGQKTIVREVLIDYTMNWQINHWRSLLSAYNSSPFLEYYEEEFYPFYHKRWKYLIDFNVELQELIGGLLELDLKGQLTSEYVAEFNGDDYRQMLTSKSKQKTIDSYFKPKAYTQTFADKYSFVPNLSILDLLFNVGPESSVVLDGSIVSEAL